MKSHVSMEQKICPVCTKTHETNAILLHKRMSQTLDPKTVTGWLLCPEHQKAADDGYIALVGCDPAKSNVVGERVTLENAYRTGSIVHVRRGLWPNLFDRPAPDGALVMVEEGVIDWLRGLAADASQAGADHDQIPN